MPKRIVVFVPGYKGTELKESGGHTVWVTVGELLFGSHTLALPIPALGGTGSEPGMITPLAPGRVLEGVSVLPFLYSFDVYHGELSRLVRSLESRYDVVPFPYDWRGDIRESAAQLGSFIDRLRTEGAIEIHLLGHSMGGLVAATYLRCGAMGTKCRAEIPPPAANVTVRSLVLLDVPFGGSLSIFDDFLEGASTVGNRTLLSKVATGTFPSAYQLLPRGDDALLELPHCIPRGELLRSVDEWERRGWGPFSRAEPPDTKTELRSYVAQQLQAAAELHSALADWHGETPSIRVLAAIGTRFPTRQQVTTGRPSSVARPFSDGETECRPRVVAGDGTVTARDQNPPAAFFDAGKTTVVYSGADHVGVVGDEAVREAMERFLKVPE